MSAPTHSWRRVAYNLRAAKQVERRMIIDALLALSQQGWAIREYQYTGMGSVFFADFVLPHKFLGISDMLSVEFDEDIRKRVEFNRPFGLIELAFGRIGEYIPTLDVNKKHILWLDYDDRIRQSMLHDIESAADVLPCRSVILITVDIEPPQRRGDTPDDWMSYYEEEARDYFDLGWSARDFARSRIASTAASIVTNAIGRGLAHHTRKEYIPMFAFVYADGHRMLTVGGALGSHADRALIQESTFAHEPFARLESELRPFEIRVPVVTPRERAYLDRHMPFNPPWSPEGFELTERDVRDYSDIYRFLPQYAELLQ